MTTQVTIKHQGPDTKFVLVQGVNPKDGAALSSPVHILSIGEEVSIYLHGNTGINITETVKK